MYLAEVAKSDEAFKSKLRSSSSGFEFWDGLEHEFPSLCKRAVEVLLQFPTLYMQGRIYNKANAGYSLGRQIFIGSTSESATKKNEFFPEIL